MPSPRLLLPTAPPDLYNQAKAYHERLLNDHDLSGSRDNWLECLRQFRRVQFMHAGEELTANSIFMQGRLYREMFERFRMPLDLDNAIDAFDNVAASYPESALADDALYYSAIACLLYPARKERAKELLFKIAREYPDSDHAGPAVDLLRQLSNPAARSAAQPAAGTARVTTARITPLTTIPGPAGAEAVAARAEQGEQPRASGQYPVDMRTRIDPVKHWSSDDYTRVVIPAAAAVPYTATLLEARDGFPPRLVIDFAGSVLAPDNRAPHAIGDGLLKQVRTGQYTLDTVRLVLDIESISDYRIFSLPEPFRVIVDVHGKKAAAATAQAPPRERPALAEKTPIADPAAETGKAAEASRPTKAQAAAVDSDRTIRTIGIAPKTRPAQQVRLLTPPRNEEGAEPAPREVIAFREQKKSPPDAAAEPAAGKRGKGERLSLAQQLGLGVRHIVIDPGHGGKDPGAMAFGLKEKDVVLKLARKVAGHLKDKHGYEVSLTRDRDIFIPLEERTAIANTKKADLFLSLHLNAHKSRQAGGVETYFLNLASDADAMRVAALENATSARSLSDLQDILQDLLKNTKIDESSQLARFIHRSLARGLKRSYKIKNLGVKQAPFYVLIGAEMPAVLIEASFITNPTEAKLLQQDAYLDKIAAEIANGLNAYVQHHHSAALRY